MRLHPYLPFLLLAAAPAYAQTTAEPNAVRLDGSPTPPTGAEAGVPQTFDWWKATPIPTTTPWGQPVDTASTRQIRSWTTMPQYTNTLVDHLPASEIVPPADYLRFRG